jgi:hypothetical protein
MTAYKHQDPKRRKPAAVTYLDPMDNPNEYSWGHKSTRAGACARGCCWTPWGVCWYLRRCTCHHTVTDTVVDELEGLDVPDEDPGPAWASVAA